MSFDNISPQMDEQQKLWASIEDVKKVQASIDFSQKLVKVNDILQVLDLPYKQEVNFRKTLEKQDNKILKELVQKSKNEILIFLLQAKKKENIWVKIIETEKRWRENERIDKKISKIKSVFTDSILDINPDIADKLNSLDSLNDPLEKNKTLQEILQILKNPWILKSIIEELGGADRNNPKYEEFKNTLVGIDTSFESYFDNLESISDWISSSTDKIVSSIETDSEWLVSIDLNSDTPVSKMNLPWSSYSFNKAIDKQALLDIKEDSINELTGIRNSYAVLKGLYKPFDSFVSSIRENWWKQDLKVILKNAIANFSKDIFSGLNDAYETLGIKSDVQITESDISSFADINSENDLRLKIENIKKKFAKIESQAWKVEAWAYKDYQIKLKEFLEMKSEQKEKQKKVLEFLKKSGFDLIPKDITNRIIRELQSNTLIIPWLKLSLENIDLKNWNFWESWAFIDKEAWINMGSKTNILKFMNKLISWNINEPLSVKVIANGISVINQNFLKHKFSEADVVNNLGWNYSKITENLKKSWN